MAVLRSDNFFAVWDVNLVDRKMHVIWIIFLFSKQKQYIHLDRDGADGG